MDYEALLDTAPTQLSLGLEIAVEREIDGVRMGVLSDGTPFLTIRGLARMCGVDHTMIVRITSSWIDTPLKPREAKIRELVRAQGADDKIAFYAIEREGSIHHAVPPAACMAMLEYYAFEAKGSYDIAALSYRTLARKGLSNFIYSQIGYNPSGSVSVAWQQFHDRVSLSHDRVPDGYFSVYKEIAGMIVTMINSGIPVGTTLVPDISVGIRWSNYWKTESLEVLYGERIKYVHDYPSYFPQAVSNPQQPFCYPDDALGEFRKWLKKHYLKSHLPTYLQDQSKKGKVSPAIATSALQAFSTKVLPKS